MNQAIKQFIKFACVGFSSTIIDLVVLNLLVIFFHTNVYFASTISFILAASNAYFWNRIWTFRSQSETTVEYIKFIVIRIGGLGLNLLAMYVLIQGFDLWYNFAKGASLILVLIWNFFWSKYWVFRENKGINV